MNNRTGTHVMPPLVGLLLCVVVGVGGWLRFTGLAERGLLFFDEGVFVSAARFMRGLSLQVAHHGWASAHAYVATSAQWSGVPSPYARPMHDFFLMLAMLVGGPGIPSALQAMAVAGMLTMAGVYWLGRRLFDPWVGLMGAAVSAISCYQLAYARSALGETDAMLWFLLAVGGLVWPGIEGRSPAWRRLLLSGGCGAMAFLSSYRLWIVPVCLCLVEALRARAGTSTARRALFRRCALCLLGLLAPVLLWIVADGYLMHDIAYPATPYLPQLLFQYGKNMAEGFSPAGWWAYPYIFRSLDGWFLSIAYLAGMIVWLRQPGWVGQALAGISLVVVLVFSVLHTYHARYISIVLPFLALGAGYALVRGTRWCLTRAGMTRLEPLALTVVMLATLCWCLPSAVAATRLRTGYHHVPAALESLAPGDRSAVITTQPFVLRVIDGRTYLPPPAGEAALRTRLAQGVRFFVLDYQLAFGGFDIASTRLAQRLGGTLSPVVILDNPAGAAPQVLFEHVTDPALTRRWLADPSMRVLLGLIAIYDLRQLPGVTPAAVPQAP